MNEIIAAAKGTPLVSGITRASRCNIDQIEAHTSPVAMKQL
jgi:hypothetical protein